MTVERIGRYDSLVLNAPAYNLPQSEETQQPEKKRDESYYQNSIASLKPEIQEQDRKKAQSSSGIVDWFTAIYSWITGTTYEVSTDDTVDAVTGAPKLNGPQLPVPARQERSKHLEAVLELQRKLAEDLEAMRQDDPEGAKAFDKLMIKLLYAATRLQSELKKEASMEETEEVYRLTKEKKARNQEEFSLKDALLANTKTGKYISWVNFGATVGMVGVGVASVLSSGGVFAGISGALSYAQPMLTGAKGLTSGAEGYMRYQTERLTGDLFAFTDASKKIDTDVREKLSAVDSLEKEITDILEKLRHILESHNEAARAMTGNH